MRTVLFRLIAEVNIIKFNVAPYLGIGDSAVCLVRVFPSPASCAVVGLCDSAVCRDISVYKSYIAVVCLGFFVNYSEDALCSCKSGKHRVELLRYLRDRLRRTNV